MSWWSTLLGGTLGYAVGGPIGAAVGAALGHVAGNGDDWARLSGNYTAEERIQMAYFTTTFAVMGHIAKADGRVSESEIKQARAVMTQMNLDEPQRDTAIRMFQQGKRPGFQLKPILGQFRKECRQRKNLFRLFVEIQLQAALSDGDIQPAQRQIFSIICSELGIPQREFAIMEQAARDPGYDKNRYRNRKKNRRGAKPVGGPLGQAYRLLGVGADASDMQVTRAYRRLINQHHPDKLVAKGLPEEMMKMAEQKTQQIIAAYENIKDARGIR